MDKNLTKSRLAIILSKFEVFKSPKADSEQYTTDSEIAAEVLWNAALLGDIYGKVSADLGAGTGILGLGAAILGSKKAILVESESSALDIAQKNYKNCKEMGQCELCEVTFKNSDIADYSGKVDVVLQNPPFGTKVRHADRKFLEKAVELAPVVYTFHKSTTADFVQVFAKNANFKVTHTWHYDFPLKATFLWHRRRIRRIKVSCFRLKRQ